MKNSLKYIVLLFAVVFICDAYAQQQLVFTNYLLNSYYYNPAIAGSKNVHEANLSYRNQWVGFEGAPKSIIGSFHGSLRNEGKVGYGATIISDKSGLIQNTGFYLNYAQHFRLGEKVKLGFGLQPGFIQYRIRLYDAQVADEGDNVLTGNILASNGFDLNGGFNLYSEKFFVMGSVQSALGKEIQFTTLNSSLRKHYTVITGYNLSFKKSPWEFQPSVMMRNTTPVPNQWTIMGKVTYNKQYWGGILYRTENAAGICLGINVKDRLSIGYAFDYSMGGISQYQSGTHEFVISFVTTANKPSIEEEDEKLNNSIMDEMKKHLDEKKKKESEEK
jgi:type IX secretion system PorP/SprF family membrane protein